MLIRNVVPLKAEADVPRPLEGHRRDSRFDRDGSSASAAAGERYTQGFRD